MKLYSRLLPYFFALIPAIASASGVGTYDLEISESFQLDCFSVIQAASQSNPPYYMGPADTNGNCMVDQSKKCNANQDLAVFPLNGQNTQSKFLPRSDDAICVQIGQSACEVMDFSVLANQNGSGDTLVLERSSFKSKRQTSSEKFSAPISAAGAEGTFVLPMGGCAFDLVTYRLILLK